MSGIFNGILLPEFLACGTSKVIKSGRSGNLQVSLVVYNGRLKPLEGQFKRAILYNKGCLGNSPYVF